MSKPRYMRMTFLTKGNKIDTKTLKSEYSDYPDFRKNKKWFNKFIMKLKENYEYVWKKLQGMR